MESSIPSPKDNDVGLRLRGICKPREAAPPPRHPGRHRLRRGDRRHDADARLGGLRRLAGTKRSVDSMYEGQFSIKYKVKFLALSYQQYSRNVVHMKALGILFQLG